MKAIIRTIRPFDAADGAAITFSWSGAQQVKNRIVVRDYQSNTVVYQAEYESFKGVHVIPPDSGLENGKKYNIVVYVTDTTGQESEASSPIQFRCFTNPVFKLSNMAADQIVTNANLDVELFYSQEEGELLDSWQVILYNTSKSEVWNTGITYNTDILNTRIVGLRDRTEYYIRALGTTINGMLLDTGYIHFTVTIEASNVFFNLELMNRPDQGAIHIKANVVSVQAVIGNGSPIYIDGEYLDLRNNYIYYNRGFSISGNFSLFLKLYGLTPNKELLKMANGDSELSLTTRTGIFSDTDGRIMHMELHTHETPVPYVLYSNYIPYPGNSDILLILLERIDGQYRLRIKNMTLEGGA